MRRPVLCLWGCLLSSFYSASNGTASPSRALVTIVDLTHELNEDNPKWPTHATGLVRNETIGGSEEEGIYYKIQRFCLPSHLGTNLDAPCHYNRDGWCIADIPLERLVLVPVSVIDIRHKVFAADGTFHPDAQLTVEDIVQWETKHGQIPEESVVLALTGWERFWEDDSLFRGTSSKDPIKHRFPGLSPKAVSWLLENRPSIYGVGIDTISIDYGRSRTFTSHTTLANANKYILENLMNLHKLPSSGALLNVGAMKLGRGASGVPARVIASFYSAPKASK